MLQGVSMRTRGRQSKVKSDEISGVFYSVLFTLLLDSVFSGVFRWLLSSNVRDGDTNGHPGYQVHKSATLQLDGTRNLESGRLFVFFTSPSAGRAKYVANGNGNQPPRPILAVRVFSFISLLLGGASLPSGITSLVNPKRPSHRREKRGSTPWLHGKLAVNERGGEVDAE